MRCASFKNINYPLTDNLKSRDASASKKTHKNTTRDHKSSKKFNQNPYRPNAIDEKPVKSTKISEIQEAIKNNQKS